MAEVCGGPIISQYVDTPVDKACSIQIWFSKSGVEEFDWLEQRPSGASLINLATN